MGSIGLASVFFLFALCTRVHAADISITNPGAETNDFTGWDTNSLGDPWVIADGFAHSGTKSFLNSFLLGTMTQTIDLLEAGFTEEQLDNSTSLTVSAWVIGYDGGSGVDDNYNLAISLQGAGHGAIVNHSTGWGTTTGMWTQVHVTVNDYGPGLRYLVINAQGFDSAFWDGNYGSAYDDFTATITLDETEPSLLARTPENGAERVERNTDLVLEFDEDVTVDAGDLVIYRASNDAVEATIDITSEAVTGEGTDTLTIDLPDNLSRNRTYYVLLDEGAIEDLSGNDFEGFNDPEDWVFEMERASGGTSPEPSVVDYANSLSNIVAEETTPGTVELHWTNTLGNLFGRVSVKEEGGEWHVISGYLADASFEWEVPEEWRGKKVQFFVESGDLVTTLARLTSTPLRLSKVQAMTQTPEPEAASNATDVTQTTAVGTSPVSGQMEEISTVRPGDYIRGSSFDTVYLVTEDLHRRPILNAQTFFTWESSFSVVHFVTDATLPRLPLGAPVLPKPGVVLVKIDSLPDVFALQEKGGKLLARKIKNEDVAQQIYGIDWVDYVIDLSPAFFRYLIIGEEIEETTEVERGAP